MRLHSTDHRRRPGERSRTACRVIGVALWLACAPAGAVPPTSPGAVLQASPVPPQFGFYRTQWRRWDAVDAMPSRPSDAATPAGPPRSVVPGIKEEDAAQPPGGGNRTGDATTTVPVRPRPPAEKAPTPGPRPAAQPPNGANREPLPPPAAGNEAAQPGAAVAPPTDPQSNGRFLVWLSCETAAARSGAAADQAAFTQRLISELLAAHDPETRKAIVEAAAGFETPAAAAICVGALEDPSPVVRMTACTVCARRDGVGAVPLLARRCAADPDLGVRLHAIKVLGDSRDPSAIPALTAALDDPDPAVRGPTIDALKRVSGRNLGDDAAAWRRWAANPGQSVARWWMTETLRKLF